ncbi:glutamate--tRNA ligase [Candidatus Saccharibacteria bacterium]|nr:glutamate--tRNA ligase [Candidatus Saccharibacteria bacterium]
MSKPVRTRFAPSPTGFLHVGNVRTALFAYLFAKNQKGSFILRLEDTDRERFVDWGATHIVKSLDWLGLKPDEGVWYTETGEHAPYVQSKRLPNYQEFAEKLIKQGNAYYSYITPEEFQSHKAAAIDTKKPFVYKQNMEPEEHSKETNGYPVRLKVPAGVTKWKDELRGEFETKNELIDDFILIKADGFPTYNFAHIVDDYLMKITHIIRGDEFISSMPKYAALYDLLKIDRPTIVHMPPILGPDGKKKLSKRDGDVDVLEYKEKGYLPEALVNFLALLGWNDGTEQEIFSHDELVKRFSLDRVQKSPAVFDINRLAWMNGEYIRELPTDELLKRLEPFLPASWYKHNDYLTRVVELDKDRIKKLSDAEYLMEIFFTEPKVDKELLTKKDKPEDVENWLEVVASDLKDVEFNHDVIEKALRKLAEAGDINTGNLFYALRIALTGRTEAPGLFDIFATLGKEESLKRLETAKNLL